MCGIYLGTPIGLITSICGLAMDRTKWFAAGGLGLSAAMALVLISALLR